MNDVILRGTLAGGQARVFFADTTQMVEQARRIHGLSPTATAALGRLITGAAMMGQTLKEGEQSLTLTIRGGGPIGTIMAVARNDGAVKAYAAHPQVDLPPREDGKLDVGSLVGKDGTLTVARDPGSGQPYSGQSQLRSGEIAEDLAWYYTISEQQPSLVVLGVLVGTMGEVLASAGLIVQPLPGCDENVLQELEDRAPVYADISRHLEDFADGEALLKAFTRGMKLEITQRTHPVLRCDCSLERVQRALIALGAETLIEMEQDEMTHVCCQFCGKEYNITRGEIHMLYEASLRKDTDHHDEQDQHTTGSAALQPDR